MHLNKDKRPLQPQQLDSGRVALQHFLQVLRRQLCVDNLLRRARVWLGFVVGGEHTSGGATSHGSARRGGTCMDWPGLAGPGLGRGRRGRGEERGRARLQRHARVGGEGGVEGVVKSGASGVRGGVMEVGGRYAVSGGAG